MIPKYRQVTEWITDRISSGALLPGDKLESENVISARFGISRQTVRHALDILGQQGILESKQGSGTFVKDVPLFHKREISPELSSTVTIISTYVDGYIFLRILQAMAEALEEFGYNVRIMFTSNRLETERKILKKLIEEECRDPLIVEPVMSGLPSPNLKYYRVLQERRIPILFFHSYYPELNIPHVSMNDFQAGMIATEYLIKRGHTKIGGIFKCDDGQGIRRYRGYLEALYRAHIDVDEHMICWIDTNQMDEFPEMAPRIEKRLKQCTALVCYNDQIAHSFTDCAFADGVRVPDDLSITSIDNSELARMNLVPLTTVSHPMEKLGRKAAENMVRMIVDPEFDATYEFAVEMEERESVKTIG